MFFTLVELLVVVSVICILMGLLLPSLSKSKTKAQITKCQDNLSQIHKLVTSYTISWNSMYPPAVNQRDWGNEDGWMNLIADGQDLRKSYVCPSEKAGISASYSLNCRELYIKVYLLTNKYPSWHDSDFAKSATGPSKILLVYETNYSPYRSIEYDKDNYSQDDLAFSADDLHWAPNHSTRMPILYADGHSNAPDKFDTGSMTYFTDSMSAWYKLDSEL